MGEEEEDDFDKMLKSYEEEFSTDTSGDVTVIERKNGEKEEDDTVDEKRADSIAKNVNKQNDQNGNKENKNNENSTEKMANVKKLFHNTDTNKDLSANGLDEKSKVKKKVLRETGEIKKYDRKENEELSIDIKTATKEDVVVFNREEENLEEDEETTKEEGEISNECREASDDNGEASKGIDDTSREKGKVSKVDGLSDKDQKKIEDDDEDDETLKEINSYLEESIDLRKKMFAENDFKSSTPKTARTKSVLSETAYLWEIIDQSKSTSLEDTRPINQGNLDTSSSTTNTSQSILLAGNIMYDQDGKKLDLSLLDEDDDDDDIQEFTIDDIIQDLDLLDETDDEDETVHECDKTVVPAEPKKVTSDKPSPSPPPPPKISQPQKPKFSLSEIKNIDTKYYRELETVYRKYQGHPGLGPIPLRQEIRRPRVFKDKSGNILGFDSLEEYIDNNHPLWCDLRNQFNDFLTYDKPDHTFASFVSNQWKSGFGVDPNRNLSCLPRPNWRNRKNKVLRDGNVTQHDQVLSKILRVDQTMENKKEQLYAMYKNAVETQTLREKEDERYERYQHSHDSLVTKFDTLPDEEERMICGFCYNLCMCTPVASRKRKHTSAFTESGKKRKKIEFQEHADLIVQIMQSRESRGLVARSANIIHSIRESYEFNSCYNTESWKDQEVVKELISLESVYDDFSKEYYSPYARDNPVPVPIPEKLETDDSTMSYSKFIEDY